MGEEEGQQEETDVVQFNTHSNGVAEDTRFDAADNRCEVDGNVNDQQLSSQRNVERKREAEAKPDKHTAQK